MTAYELFQAVFDSAREEYLPEKDAGQDAFVQEVIQYADGAFDMYVSKETAKLIANAYLTECDCQDDFWHQFEKQMREIEL